MQYSLFEKKREEISLGWILPLAQRLQDNRHIVFVGFDAQTQEESYYPSKDIIGAGSCYHVVWELSGTVPKKR